MYFCLYLGGHLTSQQHKLFQVINSYQDLLFTKQTYKNTEQIRLVYCLHALNHILKLVCIADFICSLFILLSTKLPLN